MINIRVAVYGNNTDESKLAQSKLIDKISDSNKLKLCNKHPQIVISVGGDGTFLSSFHHYQKDIDHIRFIGVHTGHLGFYTDWTTNKLNKLVKGLENDDGKGVSYSLLSTNITFQNNTHKKFLALNESTIKRINTTMKADVYVNNSFIEKFRGDGLCVSNPTGSTAYNKSLGGAVMCPTINAIQLTTMAPLDNKVFRALNSPLIVPKGDKITILPKDELKNVVTCDNDLVIGRAIKRISYKVSKHRIHFAKFNHIPFWTRVNKSFVGR